MLFQSFRLDKFYQSALAFDIISIHSIGECGDTNLSRLGGVNERVLTVLKR